MLMGWDIVEIIGWDPAKMTEPADFRQTYEPVFVLQRSAQRRGEVRDRSANPSGEEL